MDEFARAPDNASRSEPRGQPSHGAEPAREPEEPLETIAQVARRTFLVFDRKPAGAPSRATVWTVKYISNHFAERISLDDLARGAQLSKYHFLRKFHREAGMTPGEYLKRYRIVQAMEQLTSSRRTIKEIGQRVGYRDPAAFSRVFTQIAGTQPYLYRVTRRLKVAEEEEQYG